MRARLPTQVPLMVCHPKLLSSSSEAQNEAVACFWGDMRAITCASVRNDPLTMRAPSWILKTASSVLILTDRPGADRKLYSALWRPRKSAEPPNAKLICGSRKIRELRAHASSEAGKAAYNSSIAGGLDTEVQAPKRPASICVSAGVFMVLPELDPDLPLS